MLRLVYAETMKEAVVIYPHQLFLESPALAKAAADLPIYLVEESLILTHNPIHRQKLMLHKLSMDTYEHWLKEAGHHVIRLTIGDYPTSTTPSSMCRLGMATLSYMYIERRTNV